MSKSFKELIKKMPGLERRILEHNLRLRAAVYSRRYEWTALTLVIGGWSQHDLTPTGPNMGGPDGKLFKPDRTIYRVIGDSRTEE